MAGERPTGPERDRFSEAAGVVAGWPEVWRSLLAIHVAGPDGRCTGCARTNHGAPRWPCALATLGQTARTLHAAGPLR